MKITIYTLGVVAIATSTFFPVAAVANGGDVETTIEEIVVTATRSQFSLDTPAQVTTITAEEIRSSGATSLAQVLRNQGALVITDLFGDGSRPTVAVRGFGENAAQHALILVDGRRLNNFDIGAPDLNSVAIGDIERIEILEGSASTLYGDQAVGGVINIITQKRKGSSFAELSIGSYNYRQVQLTGNQQLSGGWSLSGSALHRETDNYRENNAATYINLSFTARHEADLHSQLVDLQVVDDYLETPGALFADEVAANRRQSTANFQDDFLEIKTTNLRFGFYGRVTDGWQYEIDATNRNANGRFLQSFATFQDTQVANQRRDVYTISPRLVGHFPGMFGTNLLVFGVDYEDSVYHLDSSQGTQDGDQMVTSVYGRWTEYLSEKISWAVGARIAKSRQTVIDSVAFGSPRFPVRTPIKENAIGGELGFRFSVFDSTEAYWRIERVYRFAKIDEYTASSSSELLRSTTGFSYEVGLDSQIGNTDLKLTLWQLDLEDEIALDPSARININLESTRRVGLTVAANIPLSRKASLSVGGSTLGAEVQSGKFTGKKVPLVASYNVRVAINLDWTGNVSSYIEWLEVGDKVSSGDFNNTFDEISSYQVLNVASSWNSGPHSVSARVNNVLDAEYSEFGAIGFREQPANNFFQDEAFQPAPEINGSISYRYTF